MELLPLFKLDIISLIGVLLFIVIPDVFFPTVREIKSIKAWLRTIYFGFCCHASQNFVHLDPGIKGLRCIN